MILGFSDGIKDGRYVMANWAIFKAKERLTKYQKYGIKVVFLMVVAVGKGTSSMHHKVQL